MYEKIAAGAIALLAACSLNAATNPDKALQTGHEYLITTNYPDNLHIVDMQSDVLYKTCQLPASSTPGMIQMSPDRKIAYILVNHYADVYGVDVDTCKPVFHAHLAQKFSENARSMWGMTVSHDGKEIYVATNPTLVFTDHYEVQPPRLDVYASDGGMSATPIRSFPAPRQLNIMQSGHDGSLYVVGADIYKVDTQTGKFDVIVPSRNWKRPNYSPPDVLYIWNQQTYQNEFALLYTASKFKDDKKDPATADAVYGFFSIDLATGKTTTQDFAPLTEVYFSGMRSPQDPNLMFAVLHRFTKYDIAQQKLLKAAPLDHTYYCVTLSKAGNKAYLTGTFNDVAIFDTDKMERIGHVKLPGGDMSVTSTQAFIR